MQINQRFGLTMIIATLLVMVATVYLLFDYQRSNREDLARAQGLELVRLLSGMSWNELVPEAGRKGILAVLKQGQSNPDFAYAAVVDTESKVAVEVTRSGVILPEGKIVNEPTSWLGQRVLTIVGAGNQREFIESHAPVFDDGLHMGFVRLGYLRPGLKFSYHEMPFLASVMLPIFLLVPFFYFMLRREIKPLKEISERFESLAEQGGLTQIEVPPSEALNDFMEQVSSYIDATQTRIEVLSQEHDDLTMSSKLLTYKNNRVDAILQNFPDAIMVIDEAGEVSYANGKIERLLGVEAEAMLGKKIRDWCDDPQIIPLLTFGDVKSNLQANQDTVRVRLDGNSEKSLQFSVYPLFTPKNESKILGRLVVIRDVSESHEMRQRQTEFISHISHELKTPLNVLSMYSESLLTEGSDNEEYRIEAVNVIHDEVERLSTLINNLLAINQYELGGVVAQRNHVRLHEFLEDAFNNIAKARGVKDIEFDLDIPREMGMVYIDKDLFRIAVNNLLTNAIKYSKPGGKVSLSASENEDNIEIVVSDEGYGIAESDVKQIFNKFFRSTDDNIRKQTGHGLGLSLARQIVLMHHGDLTCSSELGKGSRFVIQLEKVSTQIMDAAAS
ncbi:MAG: PAS domain-containing sensor histidine kinase [Gammaproteobacteria bacterium]|nr:PAS domain-containing sensor histidine kinase [Gammaproteobacteria bacterium]MDH3858879.1 PAS domain-containing sensor histidine kinase [Gammaproteobacteria bacterium]